MDKLVFITSGNAGYSLLKFSEGSDIKVFCVVDKKLKEMVDDLRAVTNADVIEFGEFMVEI